MRLGRYLAALYAAILALTLAFLVTLVVAVTLVERAGELSRSEAGASQALALAAYGAVEYAYMTLPIALLLALLVCGTSLARQGETLAIGAAGLGPWRVGAPFAMVAAGAGLACTVVGEVGVPWALDGRQHWQSGGRRTDALSQFYARRAQWFRQDDMLWYLPSVDAAGLFADPVLYRLCDGQICETVEARALRHGPRGWWLEDAQVHALSHPEVTEHARLPVPLRVSPRDLTDVTGHPRSMTAAQLGQLIARRETAGFDVTAHRLEWHNRWAHPASGLVLVLWALPRALSADRRRSLAGVLGIGVACVAVFLCADQVLRLLALAHKLPPWVGAWGAALALTLVWPVGLWGRERRSR